jgi:hypothetical protein
MVANQVAPEGFDIIIDAATHLGALSRVSFWQLLTQHLKRSGLFVIEDWGTGNGMIGPMAGDSRLRLSSGPLGNSSLWHAGLD